MECDHKADRAAFFVTDHTESSISAKPTTQSHGLIACIILYNITLAILAPGKGRQNNVTARTYFPCAA